MAGGIRNWDQHTGLVSNGVSSCISLLFDDVWDPKDISWDLSVGHDVWVKHRSKRTQELSPGSTPNKPAIQALLLVGNTCGAWGWPGLGCAALREDRENLGFTQKDRAVLAAPALRLMGHSCLTHGWR